MDLFGVGSFTGKGIYDVDAFEAATGTTFPENQILSHDLIEGNYARCGLLSDTELFDDFPARYHAYACREHRWVRGDWQLLPWLGRQVPTPTDCEPTRCRSSSSGNSWTTCAAALCPLRSCCCWYWAGSFCPALPGFGPRRPSRPCQCLCSSSSSAAFSTAYAIVRWPALRTDTVDAIVVGRPGPSGTHVSRSSGRASHRRHCPHAGAAVPHTAETAGMGDRRVGGTAAEEWCFAFCLDHVVSAGARGRGRCCS